MSGAIFQALLAGSAGVTSVFQTTATAGSSSTPSWGTLSVGTATPNRIVVVLIGSRVAGGSFSVTSVTIGGITATLLQNVKNSTSGNSTGGCIAYAVVPTGTTAAISGVFSIAASSVISVYSIYGNLSGVASASTSGVTNASPQTSTINVPANGTLMASGYNGANAGTVTSMAGATTIDTTSAGWGSGRLDYIPAQTGLTVGPTYSAAAGDTVMLAVAFGA